MAEPTELTDTGILDADGKILGRDSGALAGFEWADKADDADLTAHEDATTSVHGIADTSALLTTADIGGSDERGVQATLYSVRTRLADGDLSNGWVNSNGATAITIQRQGRMVTVCGQLNSASASGTAFYTLPTGFRPSITYAAGLAFAANGVGARATISPLGVIEIAGYSAFAGGHCTFTASFMCEATLPPSVPGTIIP